MEYLNTKWHFTPFEENNSFTFSIDKRDNEFYNEYINNQG